MLLHGSTVARNNITIVVQLPLELLVERLEELQLQ